MSRARREAVEDANEEWKVQQTERMSAFRQGAVTALRAAARSVYNGADDHNGTRGRTDLQALYNEGASPWLEGLADEWEAMP